MTIHVVRGFDPQNPATRTNSRLSKAASIDFLAEHDHTKIALLTTPGPAAPFEQIEEDALRREYPQITLDVFRYETDPRVAEEHELICGDMTLHALACSEGHLIHPADPVFRDYQAVILEWDGTQTHSSHLKDGTWNRMMLTIRRLIHDWNVPIMLAYTHSVRSNFESDELQRTSGDLLAYNLKQKAHKSLPWEAYLVRKLINDLEVHIDCIWDSRYHWLKERRGAKNKKLGSEHCRAPCYRWVFAINP